MSEQNLMVSPEKLGAEIRELTRQAKAMIAFNSMRAKAAANGYMSDEDIEAEIAAVRRGE